MLITNSLQYTYDQITTLRFPDIHLETGDNLLILGPSGVGKTTLLHLIAGLLSPQSGHVELLGQVLHTMPLGRLDRFRGKHIGLVFQRPHFVHSLTLGENLALVQYLGKVKKDHKRIDQLLESLNIGHKKHDRPHRLSQGEQQRAAIAIAVLNKPELILADEPTSSLDDSNCQKVAALLKDQAEETGAQLVVITHDHRLKSEFRNTITL